MISGQVNTEYHESSAIVTKDKKKSCFNQVDLVLEDIRNILPNTTISQDENNHPADTSGQSKTKSAYIEHETGEIWINWGNGDLYNPNTGQELIVLENGNLIIGSKSGKAETIDGYEIIGENFVYNNQTNKFELEQYKKTIEDDLITKIFEKLIIKLRSL